MKQIKSNSILSSISLYFSGHSFSLLFPLMYTHYHHRILSAALLYISGLIKMSKYIVKDNNSLPVDKAKRKKVEAHICQQKKELWTKLLNSLKDNYIPKQQGCWGALTHKWLLNLNDVIIRSSESGWRSFWALASFDFGFEWGTIKIQFLIWIDRLDPKCVLALSIVWPCLHN